jgi:hypothetical protein
MIVNKAKFLEKKGKTSSKAIHCFSLVLLPVVEFSLMMTDL